MKNLDTGDKFLITDVDTYCRFDDFDTFTNGGLNFEVHMRGSWKTVLEGSRVALYSVEVIERKGSLRNFHVVKRYSDFVSLHLVLRDAGYAVKKLEEAMPPKKWFGNLEGDVIMFRQRALERYLTLCLQSASPDDCSAVMDFLTCSTMPLSRLPDCDVVSPPSRSNLHFPSSESRPVYNHNRVPSSDRWNPSEFTPTSLNDEEKTLTSMLRLSNMEDDGAPSPVKELQDHGGREGTRSKSTDGVAEQITIEELLTERDILYREINKYKDENAALLSELGEAEDTICMLKDELKKDQSQEFE